MFPWHFRVLQHKPSQNSVIPYPVMWKKNGHKHIFSGGIQLIQWNLMQLGQVACSESLWASGKIAENSSSIMVGNSVKLSDKILISICSTAQKINRVVAVVIGWWYLEKEKINKNRHNSLTMKSTAFLMKVDGYFHRKSNHQHLLPKAEIINSKMI